MQNPYLVDSHCHIPLIEMEGGADAVISAALADGVGAYAVCFPLTLRPSLKLSGWPIPTLAFRPRQAYTPNSDREIELSEDILLELAEDPSVVAIGETGLDYFRSQGDLEWQRQRFRTHIRAARQINKPLVIHNRESGVDVIKILTEEGADAVGGVMHC